jgi:hypothetical protein
MKLGMLGFAVDNEFKGIAFKHKNLKKGIFHLTIVLNDYAKVGTFIQVIPYVDEN